MKIVYIYTALTSIGGADRVIVTKANYLADMGHDVTIITDSQAGRPIVFPLSVNVRHIDLDTDFAEQYHYGFLRRALCFLLLMRKYRKLLTKFLKDEKPDFVMTTCGRELDFLTKIDDKSIKIGESHIAKAYCRNFHLMEKRGFIYRFIAKYYRKKHEKAISKLDAFVVLTKEDADSWASIKKAIVIPNPYPFKPLLQSNCNSHKIISVGRLNEQKGYERLIEAWSTIAAKHSDWEINLYGTGELENYLKELIRKFKIEKSFHIQTPTINLIEKYCESSFLVMSSRFEGFPMVLLEAMSCGLPCVSFDCPNGPSSLIYNGKNGYLVENGNIKQLSATIDKMINEEIARKNMGVNAYNIVQAYSPDKIMSMWINLFNNLKKNHS